MTEKAMEQANPETVHDLVLSKILVSTLVPHPNNRPFNAKCAEMTALAESVKTKGMQVPVLVRNHPNKPGKFEILCGHRRACAAKIARIETVPAIVKTMDDSHAAELVVCENLEREDPHPLDQAAGIETLLEYGWDLESIASRLGLTPTVLAKRKQLTKLIPNFQQLYRGPDKDFAHVPLGVVERLARLPAQTQQVLYDRGQQDGDWWNYESVKEFEASVLAGVLHQLKTAPWKLDDDTLVPKAGACCDCVKRSSACPLLWGDDEANGPAAADDRCLDAKCFSRKSVAHRKIALAKLRAKHDNLILLTTGLDGKKLTETFGEKVVPAYTTAAAKAKTPGAIPAVFVDGPGEPKVIYVTMDIMGYTPKPPARTASAPPAPSAPSSLKVRKARLVRRRQAYVVDKIRERFEAITAKELAEHAADLTARADMLAMVLAFGTNERAHYVEPGKANAWQRYDRLRKDNPDEVLASVMRSIIGVWCQRLQHANNDSIAGLYNDARRMSEVLLSAGSADALYLSAEQEIPTPKVWATLKADGTPKGVKAAAKAKQ